MNILIVRRQGEMGDFVQACSNLAKRGLTVTDFQQEPGKTTFFNYTLRKLTWALAGPPNLIVYPFSGLQAPAGEQLDIHSNLSSINDVARRDGHLLILLVPHVETIEQADYMNAYESVIRESNSNVFLLYDCPLVKKPAAVAALVMEVADSGMFGRYRVVREKDSLKLKPMLMRDQIYRGPR